MKLNLNGKWLLRSSSDAEFLDADVPGTNFSALLRLGKMRDPFRDLSNKCFDEISLIANADWTFKKVFTITSDFLSGDKVYLVAKCLDTLAVLFVNDKEVAHFDNAFIGVKKDIKEYLVEGENNISIHFCAPEAFVKKARQYVKTPRNNNGLSGIVHIRKPQYHFGWDFAPYLPVSGITDDIYLESVTSAEIIDVSTKQNHHYDGAVTLTISAVVEKYCEKDAQVFFSLLSPNGQEYSANAIVTEKNVYKADIIIDKPMLWWPNGIGQSVQPLYELITSVSVDGNVVAGKILKIGIRSIKLLTETDDFGRNFAFEVNGIKAYIKGANYVSPDIIDKFDKERCTRTLQNAVQCNMNMLRVFGGSTYPNDFFFDECDRLGLLIWQDFMFGCQGYPFFLPAFTSNCLMEADYQIKRLRNHPSLALWCGNNEIEAMCLGWAYLPKYIDWANKYFYKVLPELVTNIDDRPYIQGSPVGLDYLLGQDVDNVGDVHIWNVWHGLMPTSYYKKRNPRFASEFGMESIPDIRTLDAFSDEKIESIKSPAFYLREYGSNGISKMKYYSLKNFNTPLDINGWEYISQISAGEGMRDAVSHFRKIKNRNNGCLLWQLNDMWPGISWAMTDYLGRYKAEMYYIKRLFSDVVVNIECTDGGFYISTFNDTNKSISAHLTFNVCDYDGKVISSHEKDIIIDANTSSEQMAVGMALIREKDKHLYAYAEAVLTVDGVEIASDTRLIRREKFANLKTPNITKTFEMTDNGVKITLVSNTYVRAVALKNNINLAEFSDNYFDLVPAKPKVIYVDIRDLSIDAIQNSISIFDASSLKTKSLIPSCATRLAQRFIPLNALSHLTSKRVPSDIKKRIITFYDEGGLKKH